MASGDPLGAFTEPPDEETARLLRALDELAAGAPPPPGRTVEELRQWMEASRPTPVVRLPWAQERTVPGPAGPIPVRVLVPEDVRGVYLYFHGGGWIGGGHDLADDLLWERAQEASVAVVSVGYRLAPEHPYPAAWDDCEAAALWLVGNARGEFGTDRIVVGGESAGAHLAVATLLRLRDRHGYAGFCGAELRYGMYDLRMTPSVRLHPVPGLDREGVAWLLSHVVPPGLREDPDVSPLLAPLHGLPPALFTVGTADPLVDDTLFLWARWRAAGGRAELRVWPGGMHAFDLMPLRIARAARAEVNRFVRGCVEA